MNRITFRKSVFKGYQPLNDSQRKRTVWQCCQRKQKARKANRSVDVALKNTFAKNDPIHPTDPIHPILRYIKVAGILALTIDDRTAVEILGKNISVDCGRHEDKT